MLTRQLIITDDGSTSLQIPEWNEQYHSTHGAIQEAKHVFIKNGFYAIKKSKISILEIGLGTGLNCFITFLEAIKHDIRISYYGIEAYPITTEEIEQLNYVEQLKATKYRAIFDKIHTSGWNEKIALSNHFDLVKQRIKFQAITYKKSIDLIYYDAFGPRVQPELWTEDLFSIMYDALRANGLLVTYSAKGSVRRALQKVGFTIERLAGPPGKREMLRAIKKDI